MNRPVTASEKQENPQAVRPPYRLTDFPLHYIASVQKRNFQNMTTALRPFGVTPQEWRILSSLSDRDSQTVTELAVIAVLERSRTSRTVDGMVESGLIRRVADEGDRRYAIVSLTEVGFAKYEEILPTVRSIQAQLVSGISDEDFELLMGCLKRMKENAFRTEDLHRLLGPSDDSDDVTVIRPESKGLHA